METGIYRHPNKPRHRSATNTVLALDPLSIAILIIITISYRDVDCLLYP